MKQYCFTKGVHLNKTRYLISDNHDTIKVLKQDLNKIKEKNSERTL